MLASGDGICHLSRPFPSITGGSFFFFCTIRCPPKAAANSPAELAQRVQMGVGEEMANSSFQLQKHLLCSHGCPRVGGHTDTATHTRAV